MADIIVTGYMARYPLAGLMLAYFNYVLGLSRLGHNVVYLEESGWPYSAYDPVTGEQGDFPAEGLRRTRALVECFCPGVPVVFVDRTSRHVDGASWEDITRWLTQCDLLLELGGVCWLDEFELARRRALVDMDPLFTQVDGFASKRLDAYDTHFTYGGNIARSECLIPTHGYDWIPTPPPVVMDLWDGFAAPADTRFTTVANWDAYGSVEYAGRRFGQKGQEFKRLAQLPRLVDATLEIALSGDAEIDDMRSGGWQFADAGRITDNLDSYRGYIARSLGELSAAKNAYVDSRSGWFSDRSACYLAAGRPVVLQDTGFSRWLPTGEGLMSFTDVDGAAGAIEAVLGAPRQHAAAARSVAAGALAHDVTLPKLLDRALSSPGVVQ